MIDTIEINPATKRPHRMAREPKATGAVEIPISTPTPKIDPKPAKPSSKSTLLLQMLQRPEGATIAQLVAATRWLPHTTRAALSHHNIRKSDAALDWSSQKRRGSFDRRSSTESKRDSWVD